MILIEAIRKMPHKIAEGLRDLKRGYSEEELQTARRIYGGDITSDDRSRFRSEEIDRLFRLLTRVDLRPGAMDLLNPPSLALTFALTFGLNSYLKRVQELMILPDSEIGQLLIGQARIKLQSWHQLPRTPKIVKSNPPPFLK